MSNISRSYNWKDSNTGFVSEAVKEAVRTGDRTWAADAVELSQHRLAETHDYE